MACKGDGELVRAGELSRALWDACGPMSVEGDVGRVRTGEGRGRCRMHSYRWKSKAMSDEFAPSRAVPTESTTNGSFPPRGGRQANVGR